MKQEDVYDLRKVCSAELLLFFPSSLRAWIILSDMLFTAATL